MGSTSTYKVNTLLFKSCHGKDQADCSQVNWRQGSSEAIGYQGCQEVCACHWRGQEASPLQAWHSCSEGDPEVSEVYRAAHPQAPLPASCSRDRSGFQD